MSHNTAASQQVSLLGMFDEMVVHSLQKEWWLGSCKQRWLRWPKDICICSSSGEKSSLNSAYFFHLLGGQAQEKGNKNRGGHCAGELADGKEKALTEQPRQSR